LFPIVTETRQEIKRHNKDSQQRITHKNTHMKKQKRTGRRKTISGAIALAARLGVSRMTLWRVHRGLRSNPAVAAALTAAGIPVKPYRPSKKKGGRK